MIEAGAVGATLTIVDRASPVLREIAAQFERVDVLARKTQLALDNFKLPPGVGAAISRVSTNFEKIGTSAEGAAKTVTGALSRIDAGLMATEARAAALAAQLRGVGEALLGVRGGWGRARLPGGGGRGGGGSGGHGGGGIHFRSEGLSIPGGHLGVSHDSDGLFELIGGVAMMEATKKFIESNMEMGRLESRAAASKTTSDRMGEIMKAAWKNANDNLNTTATQSYRYILELTQVTGSVDDALKMLPVVSRLQASLSSLKDENLKKSLGNSDNAYTTARSLELLGVTQDAAKLNSYSATLLQAFSGMQGTLNPQALFQTIQNAGGSRYGWNEDFVKHYVGPLTQASSRAGAGLYQLDRSYGAGVMTELMANNLLKYGFIKPEDEQRDAHGRFKGIVTGSISGYDMLRANPEEWALKVALPLLKAKGVDIDDTNSTSKAIQEISRGNKNLGVILDELLLPGPRGQLAKEAGNIDKAVGDASTNDPWMKIQAFQTKWNDLMNALGGLTDKAMFAIEGMTKAVNSVAQSFHENPAMARLASDAIASAGSLLLLSGSLAVLKMSLSGLSLLGAGAGAAAGAGGAEIAAAGGAAAVARGGWLGGLLGRVGPLLWLKYNEKDITDGLIDPLLKKLFGEPSKALPAGVQPPTVGDALTGAWDRLRGSTAGVFQPMPQNPTGVPSFPSTRRGGNLADKVLPPSAAANVNANLSAAVTTNVTNVIQIDGKTVAESIKPYIETLIKQMVAGVEGQLMGHTNEIAAYHGSGVGHN